MMGLKTLNTPLPHEVDVQEPILQARDLDIVGELEATLEGSRDDALVEHVARLFLVVGLLLAADSQPVLIRVDREISTVPCTVDNTIYSLRLGRGMIDSRGGVDHDAALQHQ
jgi:hypothetical protein